MLFVKCYSTSVWRIHGPCKKNSTLRFMVLLLAKYLPFQHVLNVFILKILNRQHSVVFIGSDNVMSCNAIVAPKGAAFKTVTTLGTCFFAVFFGHTSVQRGCIFEHP